MKVRKFIGQYLKQEDVPDPVIVTIASAKEESLSENERSKLILHFKEHEKGLVCNVTNINMLIGILASDDSDEWVGKRVVLYADPNVMYAGKRVGGIRVRAASHEELELADGNTPF